MDENEYSNIFAIPVNYTDSGKVLGGMFEMRNVIEALALLAALGYPELKLIPLAGMSKIIMMIVTLIPTAIIALVGIDGDSLFQFVGHIFQFLINRRKLHFRRLGIRHAKKEEKEKTE